MYNEIINITVLLGSTITTLLYGSLAISSGFIYFRGRSRLSRSVLFHIGLTAVLSLYYVILEVDWMLENQAENIGYISDILWLLFEVGAYFLIKGSIKRVSNCLNKFGSCYRIIK